MWMRACVFVSVKQSTPAVIMEMTAVDEPAVVQRPTATEPIVQQQQQGQQAETEVVDETKSVYFTFLLWGLPLFIRWFIYLLIFLLFTFKLI